MPQPRAGFFPRARKPLQWSLAIYWAALFVATHVPLSADAIPAQVSDKSLHWMAFTGLAFLLCCWREAVRPVTHRHIVRIGIVLIVYAALDELLQIPVGRHADFRDWIADVGGSISGIVLFVIVRKLCVRTESACGEAPR